MAGDSYSGAMAFYLNGRLIWGSDGDVTMDMNHEANAFWVDLLEVMLAEKEFDGFTLEEISCMQPLEDSSDWPEYSDPFSYWPMKLVDLPLDPQHYSPDDSIDTELETPF